MDESNPSGIPDVLPEAAEKNSRGGTHTHKPGCGCNPCTARRRKEEALTLAVRDGEQTLAADASETAQGPVIDADDIVIIPVGHRSRRTKRAIIAEWMKLRTLDPDITMLEAAKKIGIARQNLYRTINLATKEGWLRFDDPLSRVEHQLIPKTLDNIRQFLDEKDKAVTLEVAKGTIFKSYQESKGMNQGSQTVLALKIEMPEGAQEAKIIAGHVTGRPKVLVEDINNEDESSF